MKIVSASALMTGPRDEHQANDPEKDRGKCTRTCTCNRYIYLLDF